MFFKKKMDKRLLLLFAISSLNVNHKLDFKDGGLFFFFFFFFFFFRKFVRYYIKLMTFLCFFPTSYNI